ncbi:MAG TPA: cytochrome c biogenesis protein CcdA [Gemmataceae bacterium]|nr:cytochrome c biogenesis protein CcdA [Gemmataceae bacterium]
MVTLVISGTLKPGFHTYPMTQRSSDPEQTESGLSQLSYAKNLDGFQPLWPIQENPQPTFIKDKRLSTVFLEYEPSFTWSQDLLVLPEAKPGEHTLSFSIKLQTCDEKQCVPGVHHFQVPFTVADTDPLPLSEAIQKRREAKQPPILVREVPKELKNKPETQSARAAPPPAKKADTSVLGLLFTTMGAAIAMLFTPCVFPMIPITVSFFLKRSEKEHHNAIVTASVYSVTIIVVLALAVLILGKLIVDLANSPWMNLALGAMLIFFALSLFGMYELELPHFLSSFTSARESKGGYLGVVFMALTFTITSFTCTGPFLGPLLVATKEMQLSLNRLILAAFVYSATFAAPFFVLALFPSLLRTLPRSGGWLNGVKVVMGFLELAMAFKFLGNMDASLHPGSPVLFTYETVFAAWIALAAACGLYLLGLFRLPHDTPVESIGVPRFLLATMFFGLALYMTPALWHKTPQGVLGRFLVSFAPLDAEASLAEGGRTSGHQKLSWYLDYDKAREEALKENKLLFIDFTGVNCQNCRANEIGVFPQPPVQEELKKFVRVQLYTDVVPRQGLSKAEAEAEAKRNSDWQAATFQDSATPLYVIFKPDPTALEENGKLKGVEMGRSAGYIEDVSAFVSLLKGVQEPQVAKRD